VQAAFIITAIIGLIVWVLIAFYPFSYTNIERNYMLSAAAQVLAATGAIVFTVTLVAAQLSARYSPRMLHQVFSIPTIAYMALFIFSIILPLLSILLINDLLLRVSLGLTTWFLILLVPYFLWVREQLKPDTLIRAMQQRAKHILRKGNEQPEEIKTIDNVVMSAFTAKDYDTFECGIDALCNLGVDAGATVKELSERAKADRERKGMLMIAEKRVEDIFSRLRDIGLSTIEDPRAPFIVITKSEFAEEGVDGLRQAGEKAAERRYEYAAIKVIGTIWAIGDKTAERGLKKATSQAVEALRIVGLKSAERKLPDAMKWVAGPLGNLGSKILEKGLEDVAIDVAGALGDLGCKTAEIGLSEALKWNLGNIEVLATEATERGFGDVAEQLIRALEDIGLKAVEKELEEVSSRVANIIIHIGFEAEEKEIKYSLGRVDRIVHKEGPGLYIIGLKYVTERVIKALENIVSRAVEKELRDLAKSIAMEIGDFGKRAARKGHKDVVIQAIRSCTKVGAHIILTGKVEIMKEVLSVLGNNMRLLRHLNGELFAKGIKNAKRRESEEGPESHARRVEAIEKFSRFYIQ